MNEPSMPVDHVNTILIVGDDPANRGGLAKTLEAYNCRVLFARNGAIGIERAEYDQPDLIFLDVMMPGFDGFETCCRLKENEKTRGIPVILMTVITERQTIAKGFHSGAVDYITKPFLSEEITARIRAHLIFNSAEKQLESSGMRLGQEIEKRRRAETKLKKHKKQLKKHIRAKRYLQLELTLNTALKKLCDPLLNPTKSIVDNRKAVLKQAIDLTHSTEGYVSEIDPVNGDNIVYAFPEMMNVSCVFQKSEERKIRFPRGEDGRYLGLLGHCLNTRKSFYTNSSKTHPASEECTQVHFPLERFLSVPLILADEPVGQIALANKKSDYTDQDLAAICRLSELYTFALQRKQWEKALWESEQNKLGEAERIRRALLSILEDEKLAKTKIRASEEALKESQHRLQSLSSYLLENQEKNWRRIAWELHDELGQSLTVLKLKLRDIKKMLTPDSVLLNSKCEDVNVYVDHIIDSVRRLSQELCPSYIEDLGLDESIIILAEEFAKHTELQISIEAQEINDCFNLQERTFIYRIIQESLNNIQKHAKARKVSIKIKRKNSHVDIHIVDDGIGCNNEGNKVQNGYNFGLGLTAMAERARMLGGQLQVHSIIGMGTRIEVNVPIEEGERGDDFL